MQINESPSGGQQDAGSGGPARPTRPRPTRDRRSSTAGGATSARTCVPCSASRSRGPLAQHVLRRRQPRRPAGRMLLTTLGQAAAPAGRPGLPGRRRTARPATSGAPTASSSRRWAASPRRRSPGRTGRRTSRWSRSRRTGATTIANLAHGPAGHRVQHPVPHQPHAGQGGRRQPVDPVGQLVQRQPVDQGRPRVGPDRGPGGAALGGGLRPGVPDRGLHRQLDLAHGLVHHDRQRRHRQRHVRADHRPVRADAGVTRATSYGYSLYELEVYAR